MNPRFYAIVRDLHLYVGLFLSPFVLVFAISVPLLVHSWVPGAAQPPEKRIATDVALPAGFEKLKGREQLAAARIVLDRIGVHGEIGFVREIPRENPAHRTQRLGHPAHAACDHGRAYE